MSNSDPEIEHLVFWVHRSFKPNHTTKQEVDEELASYYKLATTVFDNPTVGLINIDQSNNDDNHPYFDYFTDKVRRFDISAQTVLDNRYLGWHDKYVNLKDSDATSQIISNFKLKPRDIRKWLPENLRDTRKPTFKYLGKASVFGRLTFSCPLSQARDFGLQEFAGTVRYYPQTTPDNEILHAIASGNIDDNSLRII